MVSTMLCVFYLLLTVITKILLNCDIIFHRKEIECEKFMKADKEKKDEEKQKIKERIENLDKEIEKIKQVFLCLVLLYLLLVMLQISLHTCNNN